jgi:hypothetical protein
MQGNMIDKARLLVALRAQAAEDLDALERRQKDTQEGATHEESRSEHAKDTRATEQSYLARGLAERVEDARRTLEAIDSLELRPFESGDAIAVGALVALSSDEDRSAEEPSQNEIQLWFMVPGPGGLELEQEGTRVRTLTPIAPLGRSLLGLCAGEEGVFRTPRSERSFEVLAVY